MLPGPRLTDLVIPDPNTDSTSGTCKCYDFRFELQPAEVTLVRNAIAPLSEPLFNSNRTGIISVGDAGFEIKVVHPSNSGDIKGCYTGYLCLYAERLDQFVCNKSMRNRVSMTDISLYLDTAGVDDTVAIYVESGSNLLSFDFSPATHNVLGPYTTATRFFWDEHPADSSFPVVSYFLEAVIPSPLLTVTSTDALEQDPNDRDDNIEMVIKSTSVRIQVGTYRLGIAADEIEAWFTWPYWESMRRATLVANECTLFLVFDPEDNIMLKFNVGGLGYLVYLNEGYCFCNLPVIGRFFPLT